MVRVKLKQRELSLHTETPLSRRFKRFDDENPHIWREFEARALRAAASGVKRTSAWLIINAMRWDSTIETKGEPFKVSNDYIAMYARKFRAAHPEHINLFRISEMSRA